MKIFLQYVNTFFFLIEGMQLALPFLTALETMQIKKLGAIYYTARNVYDKNDPKIGSTFSTENQISTLAGLQMLHEIISKSSNTSLKGELGRIESLAGGIKAYLRAAFKPELGYFSQGGSFDALTETVHWVPEPFFAADCQVCVLASYRQVEEKGVYSSNFANDFDFDS